MIKWHHNHRRFLVPLSVVVFSAVVGIVGAISYITPVRAAMDETAPIVIQCDEDTVIRAHYAEVLDAMEIDYSPVWVAPTRKPRRD